VKRVEVAVSVDGPLGGRVCRLMTVERSDDPAETNRSAIALAEHYGYTNVRLFLHEVLQAPAPTPGQLEQVCTRCHHQGFAVCTCR
jgi:hypothetical protein